MPLDPRIVLFVKLLIRKGKFTNVAADIFAETHESVFRGSQILVRGVVPQVPFTFLLLLRKLGSELDLGTQTPITWVGLGLCHFTRD